MKIDILTIVIILLIFFILKYLNRGLIEHIGSGVEAQLASHSQNSLITGSGEPQPMNAYTSLYSSSFGESQPQSGPRTGPQSGPQSGPRTEPQPGPQSGPRTGHGPAPRSTSQSREIERLRWLLYQQQLQQQRREKSILDSIVEFLFSTKR